MGGGKSLNDPGGPQALRRVLGPIEVTASGVGIIIGAGIYVLLGAAAGTAGAAVWLSFVLAGILSALTALSYAELASMFPRASAEYEYTRRVAHPLVAFLVGWVMVSGLCVAAAAIALGFAQYLHHFAPFRDTPTTLIAIVLLCVEASVAMGGIAISARLTMALSLLQIGGLLAVVAVGAPHVGEVDLIGASSAGGVLAGAALVFFAFIGFDEVITLAEETRNPTRVVPRALLAALAISTVLYVAVAIAAVSVVGAPALAASTRPLALVVDHAIGDASATAVVVVALLSTVNTSLLALTAASRLVFGMAAQGALPRFLARVHRRSAAPVAGIAAATTVAVAFALVGKLSRVAAVTDVAVYLVFVAVNATVIVLRVREPERPRPFRSPGSVRGVPVLPILGLLAVFVMVPQLEAEALALTVPLCAAGVIAYALRRRGGAS